LALSTNTPYWVTVRTNICEWVGADAPDAVTVTLYVVDCPACELVDVDVVDDPQPARLSKQKETKIHRARRDPNHNNGSGDTNARSNPEGAGINRLLLTPLTVTFVLCAALPDSVEGAKLQPHPLGRPEQANESEALNPFSGATETIRDPDVPCAKLSVLLESVRP
jgi:hypothetical protein